VRWVSDFEFFLTVDNSSAAQRFKFFKNLQILTSKIIKIQILISRLPTDLFTSTPNVEYLYFGDNNIKFVGFNALKPLVNLTIAIFQRNSCIENNANNRDEVQSLVDKLHSDCIPDDIVIDQKMCGDKMAKLVEKSKNLEAQVEERSRLNRVNSNSLMIIRHQNAKLVAEKMELVKQNAKFEKENRELKNSKTSTDADIERQLEELQNENLKLKMTGKGSSHWMWIFVGFIIASFCFGGFIFFYFIRNPFIVRRGVDSERLTGEI
jgi:hypothetical protein